MALRVLRHYWQLPLAVLAVIETSVLILSFDLTYVMFHDNAGIGLTTLPASTAKSAVLFAVINFIMLVAVGLYHARQRSGVVGILIRIMVALVLGWIALAGLSFLVDKNNQADLSLLTWACLFSLIMIGVLRWIFEHVIDEQMFKRRVLIYGAGRRAGNIAQLRRRSDRRGFMVLGYVPSDTDTNSNATTIESAQCLNVGDGLLGFCQEQLVDEIVVAMDDRRRNFPMGMLLECRMHGIEITELVTFLERETGKIKLDVLNPSWMLFSEGFRRGRANAVLERLFDILASVVLLVMTLPIMALAILAIKLEEGLTAPVMYRQVRVGRFGRPFDLLKFRSMRSDAEREGKAIWAKANDSRVTKVGNFMRKTRIDELPQIINVLRGEMSFVGPRPERPQFVEQLSELIPFYSERHTIKPGITGWAQLCYPYGASEQDAVEKLQYDLFYVKNHSLLFYLAILLQTVEVILWRKGSR